MGTTGVFTVFVFVLQGHNSKPGPVYAGGGYTPMSNALRGGEQTLKPLLERFPDLVNEVTTGGATPLHMCGMGRDNQKSTAYIIRYFLQPKMFKTNHEKLFSNQKSYFKNSVLRFLKMCILTRFI